MAECVWAQLKELPWFSSIGRQRREEDAHLVFVPLSFWASDGATTGDGELDQQLMSMEWLPTTADAADPFAPGRKYSEAAKAAGLAAYKEVLAALRTRLPSENLVSGPHDFNYAAKGAATYAARAMARNLVDAVNSPWASILDVYKGGNWPAGILPDGRIVYL